MPAKKTSDKNTKLTKQSDANSTVAKSTKKKTTTKKTTTTKKATATKKVATTSKAKVSKKAEKKPATKKVSSKNSTTKKSTPKAKRVDAVLEPKSLLNEDLTKEFELSEYYDLPPKYEQTIVKILAQTPNTLFIYWDISEKDRQNFIDTYGPSVFSNTKPVLIITNKTMNYRFEIDINDFANCWYLHVNDAKCEYHIELGRRPINSNIHLPNNYLYVSSSNQIEAPNDHILLEKEQKMVYFKNVKTNTVSSKSISQVHFLQNLGRCYNIYDFYQNTYKEENSDSIINFTDNTSSFFK